MVNGDEGIVNEGDYLRSSLGGQRVVFGNRDCSVGELVRSPRLVKEYVARDSEGAARLHERIVCSGQFRDGVEMLGLGIINSCSDSGLVRDAMERMNDFDYEAKVRLPKYRVSRRRLK